jgi:hypothetical protein
MNENRNPKKTKESQARFLKAFKECLFNISKACDVSKVDRMTYYLWMKTDPDFEEMVKNAEEEQIDFVESALIKRIKEGSDSSIQFYLKTKGKRKGWGENLDITTGGEKITVIRLVEKKKDDDDKSTH